MRVLGQGVQAFVLTAELVGELTERPLAVAFQTAHEVADLAQLVGHGRELMVEHACQEVARIGHGHALPPQPPDDHGDDDERDQQHTDQAAHHDAEDHGVDRSGRV